MINLGAIYFGQGQLEKAQRLNKQAISVNPKAAQAYANLGLIGSRTTISKPRLSTMS
jgi:Flp pilus assembly protein TadD